jgi:hypothetical protein
MVRNCRVGGVEAPDISLGQNTLESAIPSRVKFCQIFWLD